MKHSKKILKTYQSYPLELKMAKTEKRIIEVAENYDFYVSFSGGKDSAVAVDFTAKVLSKIGISKMHVLNINTGLEYLSVQKFCKPFCELISEKYGIEVILDTTYPEMTFNNVLKTYGYPIISKEVSQCIYEARKGIINGNGTYQYRINKLNGEHKNPDGSLSQYNCPQYKFLLDAPFRISHKCCYKVKKEPAYLYEKATGRIPIVATTTEESRARQSAWLKHGCNAFNTDRPISAPFSFWLNQDILEYHIRENLPMADVYGHIEVDIPGMMPGQMTLFQEEMTGNKLRTTGCPRTGCIYCLFGITQDKDRILRLQKLEPKRADYVLRGGEFDKKGMWIPTKEGLGYWFILDFLKENGIDIPYKDAEKYRKDMRIE